MGAAGGARQAGRGRRGATGGARQPLAVLISGCACCCHAKSAWFELASGLTHPLDSRFSRLGLLHHRVYAARVAVMEPDLTAIQFTFSARKALETILLLANSRQGVMDRHSVLKLLFFADVLHLNRYGRPIVGDQYRALPYGPVAQGTYDILKGDALVMEELDEEPFPLILVDRFFVRATRPADMALLSRSDVAALREVIEQYGALDFLGRTDLSHQHPAYTQAINRGELVMRYEDFLKAGPTKPEIVAELAEISRRVHL